VVGGAEVLFTESLKGFTDEYRHVVVYMRPPESLLPEVKAEKVYCLDYKGKYNLLNCIIRLRKIIKVEKVKLIHAHHYWPTIVARLAKTAGIHLVTTVHSLLSHDAFILNRLSLYLERFTYKQDQHLIFVSEAVAKDYRSYVKVGPRFSVIYNFVKDEFFLPEYSASGKAEGYTFRMIAVGSLKEAKNHIYLLQVFDLLKDEKIQLDIIGEGPLRAELEAIISKKGLEKVRMMGERCKLYEFLNQYNAFILSSVYEGMSLAIIEAMAIGLPCILSDIAPNWEVTAGYGAFFDLSSPEDCAASIRQLKANSGLREKLAFAGKSRAGEFRRENYLNKLESLYKQYLP
jgi:glycosyltransferase involved in cell wall biosynthesis